MQQEELYIFCVGIYHLCLCNLIVLNKLLNEHCSFVVNLYGLLGLTASLLAGGVNVLNGLKIKLNPAIIYCLSSWVSS